MTPLNEVLNNITYSLATGRFAGLAFHGIGNDPRCPLLVPEETAHACVETASEAIQMPYIGFDDAYECAKIFIRKLAGNRDVRPIVFVPTLFIDKKAEWVKFSTCNLSVMSMETLRALSDLGAEIGWHGHSHRRFTDLTVEELNAEMEGRADTLAGISLNTTSCSFPYGAFNRKIVDRLSLHFTRFYQTCILQNSISYTNVLCLLDVGTILHFRCGQIKMVEL